MESSTAMPHAEEFKTSTTKSETYDPDNVGLLNRDTSKTPGMPYSGVQPADPNSKGDKYNGQVNDPEQPVTDTTDVTCKSIKFDSVVQTVPTENDDTLSNKTTYLPESTTLSDQRVRKFMEGSKISDGDKSSESVPENPYNQTTHTTFAAGTDANKHQSDIQGSYDVLKTPDQSNREPLYTAINFNNKAVHKVQEDSIVISESTVKDYAPAITQRGEFTPGGISMAAPTFTNSKEPMGMSSKASSMYPTRSASHPTMTSLPGSTGLNGVVPFSETKEEMALEDCQEERGNWGRQIEFTLTCVGFAVGLGTVWRFPYLAYKNGGGAFLIPFMVMLALVGLPVFFLEMAFGQFSSLGPVKAWTISPAMKGLGWGMVVMTFYITLYYNVVISYSMYFFWASMTAILPWEDCNNYWNTRLCVTIHDMKNITNETLIGYNITREDLKTPSEEYFYNKVLDMSDGIDDSTGIVWQLMLCLVLGWATVFVVLIKGISSMSKVVYFTATFPYFMLTALLIRAATLEGALDGIMYYIRPDVSKLGEPGVWADAATQIFYSLCCCSGGIMAMASYNKFTNNCLKDSIVICVITCATCVYAGFVVFAVLGFMAFKKQVSVEDVATQGPGLVFMAYPEALSQMPGASIWSVLFFFMMMILGFSSEFGGVEAVFVAISDEFPALKATSLRSIAFRGCGILFYFVMTIPMVTRGGFYWFSLVDTYIGGFPLLIIGILEIISLVWIYGYERMSEDIAMMIGKRPGIFFTATWCVVSPLILFICLISKAVLYKTPSVGAYVFPGWAEAIGWLIVTSTIIMIPVYIVMTAIKNGLCSVFGKSLSPTPEWGPANRKHRVGRYAPYIYDKPVYDQSPDKKSFPGYGDANNPVPGTKGQLQSQIYENAAFSP